MKSFLTILAFATSFCLPLMAGQNDRCSDYFAQNKQTLLKKRFAVSDGFVYIVGISRKIGGDDNTALEMAETDAFGQLVYLKKTQVDQLCAAAGIKPNLASNIFENWSTFQKFKYTAKNRIELASFVQGRFAYFAAAYKIEDVTFEDNSPVTWSKIYGDFKRNPGKRNELVFYEIVPEGELLALGDTFEKHIADQYGKIFSLMFMGKEVPPMTRKKYDSAKKIYAKLNSGTGFNALTRAANILPYDENICSMLEKKFEKMDMPRCAAVMRQRAAQSKKLIVIEEKPVQPAVKPAEEKPAQPTVKPAEEKTVKPSAGQDKEPEITICPNGLSQDAPEKQNDTLPREKQKKEIDFVKLLN